MFDKQNWKNSNSINKIKSNLAAMKDKSICIQFIVLVGQVNTNQNKKSEQKNAVNDNVKQI